MGGRKRWWKGREEDTKRQAWKAKRIHSPRSSLCARTSTRRRGREEAGATVSLLQCLGDSSTVTAARAPEETQDTQTQSPAMYTRLVVPMTHCSEELTGGQQDDLQE